MLSARQIPTPNKSEEPKMHLIKYSVIATLVAASLAFGALLTFAHIMIQACSGVLAFAQTVSNAFTVF
jgi:hypothetical protein